MVNLSEKRAPLRAAVEAAIAVNNQGFSHPDWYDLSWLSWLSDLLEPVDAELIYLANPATILELLDSEAELACELASERSAVSKLQEDRAKHVVILERQSKLLIDYENARFREELALIVADPLLRAKEPITQWNSARTAYDRFIDLKSRSTAKTSTKREREAFLAAMLGTDLDANGYAQDPDAENDHG